MGDGNITRQALECKKSVIDGQSSYHNFPKYWNVSTHLCLDLQQKQVYVTINTHHCKAIVRLHDKTEHNNFQLPYYVFGQTGMSKQ